MYNLYTSYWDSFGIFVQSVISDEPTSTCWSWFFNLFDWYINDCQKWSRSFVTMPVGINCPNGLTASSCSQLPSCT